MSMANPPERQSTPDPAPASKQGIVLRQVIMAGIGFATLFIAWDLSVRYYFNSILVPSPAVTYQAAKEMLLSGDLVKHVGASLGRVLVGYFAGCAIGIVLGVLIGRIRFVRELIDPVIELVRPISPVAIVPLAMLWFGIGEGSKIFVIVWASVFIVLLNTAAGVAQTPRTRIRAAQTLGATPLQIFVKVAVPSAVPFILTGMRVALGFAFMGVVAAELIGAREGIGFVIMNSRNLMQTDQLFVGLLALAVVGAFIDRVFRVLLDRSTRRYMQFQQSV
jgi:ABC-type nitrate/sulfonate/bicarbonate transport system permease component